MTEVANYIIRTAEDGHVSVQTEAKREVDYHVGLDLGQKKDYTALVVLERHGKGNDALYHARHIERYPLGTSYPEIVVDVASKLNKMPTAEREPILAVDETGVGSPVVDLFRQARLQARLEPIHITGGSSANRERGVNYVPKRDLVSIVQVALQTGRLKIASALPEAATLVLELQNFQVKITESANDTYGAWREGSHDDLVLAVAMALWVGQRPTAKLMAWA